MLSPFFHDDFFGFPSRALSTPSHRYRDSDMMKQLQPVMSIDFVESETSFSVHAELPGVNKEDVDIKIENGALTISAEKKNKHEEHSATMHHVERSYGTVVRSIRLPKNVEHGDVHASFENGVLEVTLPKKTERPDAEKGIKVPIA